MKSGLNNIYNMIKDEFVNINITTRNISHYRIYYNNIKVGVNLVSIKHLNRGSDFKVNVICDSCSSEIQKKFNNLNRDRDKNNGLDICDKCGRKKSGESKRIDFEKVYNEFISKDIIPLFTKNDKVLTNNKLPFRCKIHSEKIQHIKYTGIIKSNYPCKKCRSKRISDANKMNFIEVKEYFISRGLNPLFEEKDFKNCNSQLSFLCNTHKDKIQHTSYILLTLTKNGCKLCFNRKGENSILWKGGITPLVRYMRNKMNYWKKIKLEEKEFKCEITGLNGNLVVHHVVNFHTLLEKSLYNLKLPILKNLSNYTDQDLLKIENELIKQHLTSESSVILKEIHILFHSLYGRKNNNKIQFDEFKNGYFKYKLNDYSPDRLKLK